MSEFFFLFQAGSIDYVYKKFGFLGLQISGLSEFLVNRGFCYMKVPFKTGFTVCVPLHVKHPKVLCPVHRLYLLKLSAILRISNNCSVRSINRLTLLMAISFFPRVGN